MTYNKPALHDEMATMIIDLSHTGDLSMLYRMAIADAITALRAENERLRATPPEVTALVEALRPLAKMANRYDPERGDGELECWSGLAVPKIKHLRSARAALAAWDAANR